MPGRCTIISELKRQNSFSVSNQSNLLYNCQTSSCLSVRKSCLIFVMRHYGDSVVGPSRAMLASQSALCEAFNLAWNAAIFELLFSLDGVLSRFKLRAAAVLWTLEAVNAARRSPCDGASTLSATTMRKTDKKQIIRLKAFMMNGMDLVHSTGMQRGLFEARASNNKLWDKANVLLPFSSNFTMICVCIWLFGHFIIDSTLSRWRYLCRIRNHRMVLPFCRPCVPPSGK